MGFTLYYHIARNDGYWLENLPRRVILYLYILIRVIIVFHTIELLLCFCIKLSIINCFRSFPDIAYFIVVLSLSIKSYTIFHRFESDYVLLN